MSAKWAPDYSKTVMSRLKTHLFPLIGARAIVDLDTHDLMRPLDAIKKRGTIDIALRVQNYLQSIMREAKVESVSRLAIRGSSCGLGHALEIGNHIGSSVQRSANAVL